MIKRICIVTLFFLITKYTFSQIKAEKLDSLKTILTGVYNSDQQDRLQIADMQKLVKTNSDEYKKLVLKMRSADSVNLSIVTDILDRYGYLGKDEIGVFESQALFLVLQHADLPMQEKYLPMIRKAVLDKKTYPSNLALMEDRVALRQGKKQIYGSQLWINNETGKKYVRPIEDPENVNKRRQEVGLEPMEEYLKNSFQMEWNLQEYYEALPELEKLQKNKK